MFMGKREGSINDFRISTEYNTWLVEYILINYQINKEINLLLIVLLTSNESIFLTKSDLKQ